MLNFFDKVSKYVPPSTTDGGPSENIMDKDVLREADAARDSQQFRKAADLYRLFLATSPGDFGIHVQLANCLKDAGAFAAADEAYSTAIKLNGADADVYLQYGHLMKKMGRLDRAIENYRRSNQIDPGNAYARRELKLLGVDQALSVASPHQRAVNETVYFFEILDLIIFLTDNMRVTGIQRVVSSIITSDKESLGKDIRVVYGTLDSATGELKQYDREKLLVILNYINSPWADRAQLNDYLSELDASAGTLKLQRDDAYVIMGAYWIVQDYGPHLLALRNQGVRIGTYIYDLIPLTHPQYVHEATRSAVNERLVDVVLLSDFYLTISEYVAKEVRALVKSELGTEPLVQAVPLAHAFPANQSANRLISDDIRNLAQRSYVLCVCTLEGRKNHLLLHDIWSALIRQHGASSVPDLILVGKSGWLIDQFMQKCSADNFLDGKIVIRAGLNDDSLAHLYEHCMFTVFPSFAEGWGLPVGESLAFGKPCVASNASSIPEVGGDLVDYFSPYDLIGARSVIETMIFDLPFREARTQAIRNKFVQRDWDEVSAHFKDSVQTLIKKTRETTADDGPWGGLTIRSGALHTVSGAVFLDSMLPWRQKAVRLIRQSGWDQMEPWGCWSIKDVAKLVLKVDGPNQVTAVSTYLDLKLPPGADGSGLVVSDGAGNSKHFNLTEAHSTWVKFDGSTDADGVLEIRISPAGQKRGIEINGRKLFVGFSGIGYHRTDDLGARLNIIEALLARQKMLSLGSC